MTPIPPQGGAGARGEGTHVDLMVMQRSCSSLRVSVKRVSPARAEAMIPALHTRESVSVDLPWSTWAITDMFLMLAFLSMMARIWSTVKFTLGEEKKKREIQRVLGKKKNLW